MSGRRSAILVVLLALRLLPTTIAVQFVQIASPLQSLTIWDPEAVEDAVETSGLTRRQRFLHKFRSGLKAETDARKRLEASPAPTIDTSGKDWAEKAAAAEQKRRHAHERVLEQAFDQGVASATKDIPLRNRNPNKYQFVGVINPPSSSTAIKWYARPKPKHAKWSLRLIHVNREAILKDLFDRNKIDIYAKYENTGKVDEKTHQPIIVPKYTVKERSWKTLWNKNHPKHWFTDSSGMYWRERRLRPGVYTDGNNVYEATYRYRDGRNGMHKLTLYANFMMSQAVDEAKKEKIRKRLAKDAPDVVIEE